MNSRNFRVAVIVILFAALLQAGYFARVFVPAKIRNDSAIAVDTRRCADALEALVRP